MHWLYFSFPWIKICFKKISKIYSTGFIFKMPIKLQHPPMPPILALQITIHHSLINCRIIIAWQTIRLIKKFFFLNPRTTCPFQHGMNWNGWTLSVNQEAMKVRQSPVKHLLCISLSHNRAFRRRRTVIQSLQYSYH